MFLTFQKMNQVRLLRASCVRAIDRLDYLGIFRVQLFHLEMSKCATDIFAAMSQSLTRCKEAQSRGEREISNFLAHFREEKEKLANILNF